MSNSFYKSVLRPLLFSMNPEWVHDVTLHLASHLQEYPFVTQPMAKFFRDDSQPVTLWNLTFPNRIGLGAGFDKNAQAPWFWWMMGYGFIELGGVTQFAQPGNPQPRVFRLVKDQAVINRMGFNNDGVHQVVQRLQWTYQRIGKPPIPVGVNLGKNKWVSNDDAARAYLSVFTPLYDWCDFFVVNVSSPNTPNLRKLQDLDSLRQIFDGLWSYREARSEKKPILLKLAPDLNNHQLDDICTWIESVPMDGLVISNTTISREGLQSAQNLVNQTGGLSGKPLQKASTEMIRKVKSRLPETIIIGVGGIFSERDALEKLEAGASLLQVYTGMIYEGPFLIKRLAGVRI